MSILGSIKFGPIKTKKISEINIENIRYQIYVGPNLNAQKMKFSIKDFFSKCNQIRKSVNQ